MEEDKKPIVESLTAEIKLEKKSFERELRGLELKAYSGVLEALRASGKPNHDKDTLIKSLREFFDISEDRHKAEVRMLAYDDKLSLISRKLNGFDFSEEWAFQAQRVYVPMGPQSFNLYRGHPRTSITLRDPPHSGNLRNDITFGEDSDHSEEDSEVELIDSLIKENPMCNGWQLEKLKSVPIAVEPGTGNEQDIEELEAQLRRKIRTLQTKKNFNPPKSPDITEAPRTPSKLLNFKSASKTTNSGKPGIRRKYSSEDFNTSLPVESSVSAILREVEEKPKTIRKLKKPFRPQPKIKIARRPESKKAKESSEETSSADEGENGPIPHFEESSRVLSPVFSEVIRTSVQSQNRKVRGFRGQTGGDRKRNNLLSNPTKGKGKARPKIPNQKSAKFKNSVPTTGSRRKSKLNEKVDYDEVLMDLDGNDLEKHLPSYNLRMDDGPSIQSFERGETRLIKEYKSDDCAVYTETLPVNFNHEDMEQVTDGVFKRPLPPSKGPKPWELRDARLNLHCDESICDENNGNSMNFVENERPDYVEAHHSVAGGNEGMILSSPSKHNNEPPSKKQRIKSPLVVNPNFNPPTNVPKVPLPAPVFSTSLSSVSKKRNNNNNNNNNNSSKPISVVDSLNLHLPTSATASSLAASSNNRRPGTATGGGCSMFSNSSALIAGARGTAPGILQQQRKAQPHILANSKVHQRTFLPPVANSSSSNNGNSNSNALPLNATSVTLACASPTLPSNSNASVAGTPHTVQISTTPIPISAISPVSPSSPGIPFQTFSGSSNSSNLNLGASGVPIGHVNRSSAGTNIIFLQKAVQNGPSVSGAATGSSNMIPVKTPPRAVILRRAQIPRQVQGNVMILDMQKNQIVASNQSQPFLQTARILNAPGELSLVNVQSSPRKCVPQAVGGSPPSSTSPTQSSSLLHGQDGNGLKVETSESICVADDTHTTQIVCSTPAGQPDDTSCITTQDEHTSGTYIQPEDNHTVPADTEEHAEGTAQDAEYAQIEAELLQMEQGSFDEVVYEEEVTTEVVPLEHAENTQLTYSTETSQESSEVIVSTTNESTSYNDSVVSVGSTDTADEISIHSFESPENDSDGQPCIVKKVTLSPMGEAKIATEAISRALSLSKSSTTAKRITFTTVPITLSNAAVSLTANNIVTLSGNPTTNHGSSTIYATVTQSSNNAVPATSVVQQTEEMSLDPSDAVNNGG